MEQLRKKRAIYWQFFSIAAKKFEEVLEPEQPEENVRSAYQCLEMRADKLFQVDTKIEDQVVEDMLDDISLSREFDTFYEAQTRWFQLKTKYENYSKYQMGNTVHGGTDYENRSMRSFRTVLTKSPEEPKIPLDNQSVASQEFQRSNPSYGASLENVAYGGSKSSGHVKRHFRLPKLELKKFDGQIKNWLGFWGQFKKIHEDDHIDDDDKFQYLIQATEPGTNARELVESFPPSGLNYHKAVDQLKSRFARDELMIENYVRELLNLVLKQERQGQKHDLRSLYDKLTTQLRSLDTLGVTSDKFAAMLYPLIESTLPEDIIVAWERSTVKNSDRLKSLLDFLRKEVETEEKIKLAKTHFSGTSAAVQPTAACMVANEIKKDVTNKEKLCIWCDKASHSSIECYQVTKMTFDAKKDMIMKKRGCYICLKTGHNAKKCRNYPKCMFCGKRHTIVMCQDFSQKKTHEAESIKRPTETLLCQKSKTTLLQTLMVRIVHGTKMKTVRILLDNGSQKSYIKKSTVQKLGLKATGKESQENCLFGEVMTKLIERNTYDLTLQNLAGTYTYKMIVRDSEKICGHVPRARTEDLFTQLHEQNIILSDTGDDNTPEIEVLIGSDFSGSLLTGRLINLKENLVAIETKLGWALQGPMTGIYNTISNNNSLCLNSLCLANIDISDLWNLETLGIKDPSETKLKEEEQAAVMQLFRETIHMNEEGRYEVSLPWKESHPDLESNLEMARKRLDTTTKRLVSMGKFKEYDAIFSEWADSNIIELAPCNGVTGHYLPHQAVFKDSSLTTKTRPVFDASARDRKGHSLNACLEKGINMLELIPKMLINFRNNAIGVTSDIKKAFLQISLAERDRDYLRFLWWKDESRREVVTYRHRRVVFGVTSSPFLLAATLVYHLDHSPERLKETAKTLKQSFYVDNCVTSLETQEDVQRFISESIELMSSAKFDLRCWVVGPEFCEAASKEHAVISVLGVLWDNKNDELYCNMSSLTTTVEDKLTKRYLLSVAQRIFDPIGFTSPTSLIPKIILQKSWTYKLNWDDELPQDLGKDFMAWLKYIHFLNDCRVPRRLSIAAIHRCEASLHVFCDASKNSYAACIFLRTANHHGVKVELVQAKSRVAPIKQITIPRLELMAALIAVRLYKEVMTSEMFSKVENIKTYFWSDASVTLTWIKRQGNWNVFVENRVKEIREHTNINDWHHIPGTLNPADLLSRGCNAKILLESSWWKGPEWLKMDSDRWPISEISVDEKEIDSERKKNVISNATCSALQFSERLTYFSKYSKVIRMTAWILRFISNCQNGKRQTGELTFEEYEIAERQILKLIQRESLTEKNKDGSFEDEGILRVKTRLTLAEESQSFKSPVLLPSNHTIVQLLVRQKHIQLQHAGVHILMTNLRESFWIIGSRRLAKKIISECVICKRYRAKASQTPFAPLPSDRINVAAAFEVTGVDLAGPLLLRNNEKCWIVLFTCAVYRAIHLELVESISTEAFIMALRRFIARRGRIRTIYSDNGTNFVGTNNYFKSLDWGRILAESTIQRIKWRFIPPSAPWWGGWWERLIRLVKEMMRRILGKASLTYVELETILCDCEATLNTRPLTYVAGDNENLKPLTPNMFVQGLPHNDVTDLDHIDGQSLNSRLRYLQKLRQDYRQRFRNEYLAMLIQRGKEKSNDLKVGDVVLIEADTKRVEWPLGMIEELFPGVDGVARVAKVRTSNGYRIRTLQRLFPLEINSCDTGGLTTFKPDNGNTKSPEPVVAPASTPTVIPEQVEASPSPSTPTITRAGRVVRIPRRLNI